MGAWIEIYVINGQKINVKSLLSWERGLKLVTVLPNLSLSDVAPLVGAWIEIMNNASLSSTDKVAPLVGAWIEI